ncbi:hypothetical protein JWJ90_15545 [Desulfobulbus rhabdoformis]|jgi:hypothetical protein|uniref:hypothetical protein n=1 Tax=Desulfobulbus rhabdoformis TaxID=34032 RepID=UPI001965E40C|nr:hypothetical protein [Desulfobulbus rhabdoformis]MBM9615682.1 hypothetical protein [Desulfobulbus rhabdoformis]
MNQSELHKAFNNFKANDQLKRKLKIFLGIGCLGMLLLGGLILWVGFTAVQQVAQIGRDVNIKEQVENLTGGVRDIPAVVKVGCWEKVQSLMNIQVWLETPLSENITSLKDACFASDGK